MIQRSPLSDDLLLESDDTLRTVVGLLDDVAPVRHGPAASPMDLHLALAILDRIYEIEGEGPPSDVADFRRAVDAEYDRFVDSAGSEVR